MDKQNSFPLFFALFFTIFISVFNFTVTNMAAIYIVGDLGGSNYISTYTITFYGLGNALGIPLGDPLCRRFSRRKILVFCLLLFALFSWVCAAAPNYFIFLASRFFQGLVTGPFFVLIYGLIAINTPSEKKPMVMSILLIIFTLAPALGACWGAWLAYDYNWRYIDNINAPIILILALFFWIRLKEYDTPLPKIPFDGIGFFFYTIGICCLTFVLTTGQEFDWYRSPLINTLTVIGVPCFAYFILRDLYHPNPLLNLDLLKHPILSFALFNLALLFSAYFGMIILLALWLNLYADYTPTWIGAIVAAMAVGALFPALLGLKRLRSLDCRIPLFLAIAFFALSSFYTMLFDVEINFGRIAFSRIVAGFGLAFFFPAIFRICFNCYPEERAVHIVALIQVVRVISCGLGTALYTTTWQRREVFYHDRLGSRLTEYSQQTAEFFANAREFHLEGLSAAAKLDYFLERESISLALNDCFYLMGWIMVGLLILLPITFFFHRSCFAVQKDAIIYLEQ